MQASSNLRANPKIGKRALDKRVRLHHIGQTGLLLFIEKGFEKTTLDEIAMAAGISRRTFFHYFKSKEDVLLAYVDGGVFAKGLRAALLQEPTNQTPWEALKNALRKVIAAQDGEVARKVDRLLTSSESLIARSGMVESERVVYETFCERWPEENRLQCRLTAMKGMGALRVAKEAWRKEGWQNPLLTHLEECFNALTD